MAGLNFDASNVDPNVAFDPIPAGWYLAKIVNSEMKPTSSGNGSYLNLELEVMEGEYAGRKVFDRLNLDNPNPTAVEIAYKQLSAICHATGVIQVQDSQQLHGIPLMVRVTVRPATDQYDASNDVKGYKAAEGGGHSQMPPQQQGGGFPQQQGGFPQQQQGGGFPQQSQPPAGQFPQQQQGAPAQQPPQGQQPAPGNSPQPAGGDTPPWQQGQPEATPQQGQQQQPQQQGPAAGGNQGTPPWQQ